MRKFPTRRLCKLEARLATRAMSKTLCPRRVAKRPAAADGDVYSARDHNDAPV